jgi:hypothetical protein
MMRLVYTLLHRRLETGAIVLNTTTRRRALMAILPFTTYDPSATGRCLHLRKPAFFRYRTQRTTKLLFAACLQLATFSLLPQFVKGQCYGLVCNQNVAVALNDNCEGSVNPISLFANYWQCAGPVTVQFFNNNGALIGSTVNGNYIGQTLNVYVTHNYSGNSCWATVKIVDTKKPNITPLNLTLNCSEDTSVAALGEPIVTDNCGSVTSLTHQDSVIDFGCGYTGFSGYFDPSNWMVVSGNNGDGGVDVTGAPEQVLVEGASHSPINFTPRYLTKFKIVIPTDGYVSFDWSSFGGSNFNLDAFYLTINNWCIQLSSDTLQNGSYTTGLLHAGDVLSFEQASDGGADHVSTIISNFHFHTLAWKVINRKWKAVDEFGNIRWKTQVITLNRATLAQVVFPPNRDGVAAAMLPCGAAADLNVTGVPFIDEDGNLATTSDQYPIDNGDCTFHLAYEDQVIPTCQGSELVLRKWTVVDDCSGNVAEHTQIIKVFDMAPPTLTCPPAMTLSTNQAGCFGSVSLPQASATDDCSSTLTIEPNWAHGNGFGPFDNIPQGTFPVTYVATDACGNKSQCVTSVTVEDAVAPTVVCDALTVASLGSDGTALVHADAVDDGSYDWCCVDAFEIKRTSEPDGAYSPTLAIDCNDLGTPVMVRLRVTDCAGNRGFCDVEVAIKDELSPVLLPPAEVTVDCSTNLGNFSQFGEATAFDNCSLQIEHSFVQNFTNCGQGTVTRTWTATDPSGNTATAQQVIHLANQTPWNLDGSQISWPPDYTTSGCNVSLEPFDLPLPYHGPSFANQYGCESIAVNYEDQIYWISEPSCYKVLRTWKVIDWCQYQPNGNGSGLWQYVQTLNVQDNEPPQFVNPSQTLYLAMNATGNCKGNVSLPIPQVSDCSDHVTIQASGDLGVGFSFQNVTPGNYQMTYLATDGCGNSSQHKFTLKVADEVPPTAQCINGLTIVLDSDGEVSVAAKSFDKGSFDNCTAQSELLFCYSDNPDDEMRTFTCNDVGQHPIQLWVIDKGSNMANCQTFLVVNDNPVACFQGGSEVLISGTVRTPADLPVGQVTVNLAGAPMPPTTTSAGTGQFLFNHLPAGKDYVITPSKNIHPANGVTTYDLVKINDHILGTKPFDFAWQLIASDANNSGSVTAADLVAIQSLILTNTAVFPNGTPSWRFISANHVFADPANPFPFPQNMSIPALGTDYISAHFTGIKTGDVTGNANPDFFTGSPVPEDRGAGTFTLLTQDRQLVAGETVEALFSWENQEDLLAWQLTLEFDPGKLELVKWQPAAGSEDLVVGKTFAGQGAITALSFKPGSPQVFGLTLKAREPVQLSQALFVSSRITPAVAYDWSESPRDVELKFLPSESSQGEERIVLYPPTPNPFKEQTALGFDLPEPGLVKITFFDATGRMIHSLENIFEKGYNALTVGRDVLPASGVVWYRIETGSGSATGRLMVF